MNKSANNNEKINTVNPGQEFSPTPEDIEAIERFKTNPALLQELLNSSESARAAALGNVFGQEAYQEQSRLSFEEFTELAEKSILTCLELVPLRKNPETGSTQVLLYQRPESDPWWPGELHSSGTVVLKKDMDNHALPFDRLLGEEGELKGGVQTNSQPTFVEQSYRSPEDTGRGTELALVYYIEATHTSENPTVGTWIDVDESFPGNAGGQVIEHHIEMVTTAARRFENDKRVEELARQTGNTALRHNQ